MWKEYEQKEKVVMESERRAEENKKGKGKKHKGIVSIAGWTNG